MKTSIIFTAIIACFSLTANASSWMHYDQSNTPIPSNTITSILHTENYTWVGTDNGLARYNGTEWETFTEETSILPENHVQDIHEDALGNIWIATYSGVVHITGQGWELLNTANSPIPSNQIKSITSDDAGNVWFGTWGAGVAMTDGAHWLQFDTENSDIPSNGIFKVSIDSNGNIWAGTYSGGVTYFDGQRWETLNSTNTDLPNNNVREVLFENGNTWFGTDDGLALIDNEGNWRLYTYTQLGYSIHTIYDGIQVNDATYFATDGGLLRIQNGLYQVSTFQNSDISSNSLLCVSVSENENLWLGTSNNGIDVYSPEGTLSVQNEYAQDQLVAYPNPVVDQLMIEFNEEHSEQMELMIHNAAGQLVMKRALTNNTARRYPINLKELPSGYFSVSLLSDSGFASKRVLKL